MLPLATFLKAGNHRTPNNFTGGQLVLLGFLAQCQSHCPLCLLCTCADGSTVSKCIWLKMSDATRTQEPDRKLPAAGFVASTYHRAVRYYVSLQPILRQFAHELKSNLPLFALLTCSDGRVVNDDLWRKLLLGCTVTP